MSRRYRLIIVLQKIKMNFCITKNIQKIISVLQKIGRIIVLQKIISVLQKIKNELLYYKK